MALNLRPMRGGELLDRTLSVLRQHLSLFLGLILVPAAVGIMVPLLLFMHGMPNHQHNSAGWLFLIMLVAFGGWLVLFPATLGATAAAVDDLVRGETPTVRACWLKSARRIPSLVGATVLKYMALGAAALVLFVPLFFFGIARAMGGPMGIIAVVISLTVGVAGISFVVWVGLGLSIDEVLVVLEDAGPLSSLQRSWDLVRGGRWRIFFLFVLYGVFTVVVRFVINLVIPLFAAWMVRHGSSPIWVVVGATWISVLSSIPLIPLVGIGLTLEYFNQRMEKEAFDLQVMMADLETPPEQTASDGLAGAEPLADGQ